jgi:hypothetical protein
MSDTSRRDAWRDAQSATTVTGTRTGGTPTREHEGEEMHLPDTLDLRDLPREETPDAN